MQPCTEVAGRHCSVVLRTYFHLYSIRTVVSGKQPDIAYEKLGPFMRECAHYMKAAIPDASTVLEKKKRLDILPACPSAGGNKNTTFVEPGGCKLP